MSCVLGGCPLQAVHSPESVIYVEASRAEQGTRAFCPLEDD